MRAAAAGVGALATLALEGLGTAAAGVLGALTEQGVGGEKLCLPCAFQAGGIAGALTVLTLGVGRIPAVQRFAGRLAAMLAESRVGQWAKAAAAEVAVAARRLRVRATGVPQGLTRAQFRELSARVRAKSLELGYGDDIVVQGSRVSGRAKPTSDIDLGIRVPPERFDEIVAERFTQPLSPSRTRTMQHAIETGKIHSRDIGTSPFRRQLERDLGMDIDLSIIRRGGPFDSSPTTSIAGP